MRSLRHYLFIFADVSSRLINGENGQDASEKLLIEI